MANLLGSFIGNAVSGVVSGAASAVANKAQSVTSNKGSSSSSNKGSSSGTSGSSYAGTNYHQDAIDAAAAGDWGAVAEALNQREQKVQAQGGDDRGTSTSQIWADLVSQYGGPTTQTQTQQPEVYQPADYSDYLKDLYASNTAAELAALKDTYEQNAADLDANATKIPQSYESARNQTAAQNAIAKQSFNEQAAALGLNSGTAGQAALANSAVLQSNLTGIASSEADALSDNALERQKLAIAYSNAVDQAKASGNSALAEALYQEYVRQDEAYQQAAAAAQAQSNWAAEFGAGQQQYADSLADSQKDYSYNLAMTMLSAGVMPDSSTLAAAGISTAEAQGLIAAVKAADTGSGGTVTRTQTTPQQQTTPTVTAPAGNELVSFDYSPDEGVFKLNGKSYNSISSLAAAVDSANLTAAQKQNLASKLNLYGFDVSFG